MGMIIQVAASLVVLVCWIIVIVKLFQAKQMLLGILSIIPCGALGGYICGWIKSKELGLKNIMLIFTAGIVVSIIGAFLPGGSISQGRKQVELEMSSPGTQ